VFGAAGWNASRPEDPPMGSSAENKRLALDTWEALRSGDVKRAFAHMSDDVTWRIPGSIEPISGLKRGKGEILGFLRWAARTFPSGFQTEVRGVYGDGGTVIVELVNRSTAANGRPYANEYCFVFEIEDGRIRAVREYVDTQKVVTIVGD
jgi:hypothetical protein